ncbi:unnamed protein product [Oppiella nova]|uniref:Uncharacterized protein n=1 Tax=Oppiella nova TaxID=334625 RepID=A0A7R9MHK9_9ACAR|nr:unnamed protein product [Oppiella nova]CAG2177238.1 unnamed protein product [Oppiella nova]
MKVIVVLCLLLVVSAVCYGAAIKSDFDGQQLSADMGVNEVQEDQACGGGQGGGSGGAGGGAGGDAGGDNTQNSQGRGGKGGKGN